MFVVHTALTNCTFVNFFICINIVILCYVVEDTRVRFLRKSNLTVTVDGKLNLAVWWGLFLEGSIACLKHKAVFSSFRNFLKKLMVSTMDWTVLFWQLFYMLRSWRNFLGVHWCRLSIWRLMLESAHLSSFFKLYLQLLRRLRRVL